VLTPLGASGKVSVRNERGNATLALDAQGYFIGGTQATGDGSCAMPVGEAGYTSVFDGRAESNLSAWRNVGSGLLPGGEGCRLKINEGPDTAWYAARSFGNDYTVKLDWFGTTDSANTGLMVMFPDPGTNVSVPFGNGVEVTLAAGGTMGSIVPGKPVTGTNVSLGTWHTVEVTVAWNTVIVKLDDQEINRHTVTEAGRAYANSFIGVRDGDWRGTYLRNVRVKNNAAVRNGEIVGVNNRCIDVPGYDPAVTQLQMWDCNNFPNQRWTTTVAGTITNAGKCLGAHNSGTAAGTAVTLQTCTTENQQQWVVKPDGTIVNARAGRCLTTATTDRSAPLVLQDCASRADQVWRLPDQRGQNGAFVNPASGRCMDVNNNDPRTGKIHAWDCYTNTAQSWAVVGDGRISISGRCLDVSNNGTAAGTAVQIANCNTTSAQQWQVRQDGTVVHPFSGRCLTSPATSNGTAFTIQDCTGQPSQSWRLSAQTLWTGNVVGVGGKCADVKGEDPANGTVWLWQCFGPPGETWAALGDGALRSLGACLDVGGLTNGIATGVANCHNGSSQQWAVRPDATLVNVEASRCMDVHAGITDNGAKIQLWDCVGTPQQRWAIPLRAS
jgi:hypothetical protein